MVQLSQATRGFADVSPFTSVLVYLVIYGLKGVVMGVNYINFIYIIVDNSSLYKTRC